LQTKGRPTASWQIEHKQAVSTDTPESYDETGIAYPVMIVADVPNINVDSACFGPRVCRPADACCLSAAGLNNLRRRQTAWNGQKCPVQSLADTKGGSFVPMRRIGGTGESHGGCRARG
jgi:hypothetical protein